MGQVDADNRREKLWRQTYGQSYREEQGLKWVAVQCDTDEHQEHDEKQYRAREKATEFVQPYIERGLFGRVRALGELPVHEADDQDHTSAPERRRDHGGAIR